ncbi:hypothetical protein P3W45_001607 [Vairimorpha bombi]
MLKSQNILVVGTGGIGCELVKLLYINPQKSITLIDFDTIEITNLNRQFLFTESDIGRSKSEVVAERMNEQFDVVYNCLDNDEARSYVNLRCFLSKTKLIDGGSGGYLGQSCVFDYTKECFDCLPKMVQTSYNVCTIRSIPTKFEHCIEFAKSTFFGGDLNIKRYGKLKKKSLYKKLIKHKLQTDKKDKYNEHRKDIKKIQKYISRLIKENNNILEYDKDNLNMVKLLYRLSCIRSRSANIETKNFFDFQSIANSIIPSLCTTNSIVASLMLLSAAYNKNYFLTLTKKLYLSLDPNEKNQNCGVCSKSWIFLKYKTGSKANELFKFFNRKFDIDCKYLMNEDNSYLSKIPNNLDKELVLKNNSISTLSYDNGETMKIYILENGDKFEIMCNV